MTLNTIHRAISSVRQETDKYYFRVYFNLRQPYILQTQMQDDIHGNNE